MNKIMLLLAFLQGSFFVFFTIELAMNIADGRVFWSLWDLVFAVWTAYWFVYALRSS